MESIRNRAKDKFPMVLLTLLSIVQALALEFIWDHTRHRPDLLEVSLASFAGWLQVAATLNLIILIWLMYGSLLMRFRWTPSTVDSIFPFFVGLVQFLMIDIMGADHIALWIIILGLTYGAMVGINQHAMRRARHDPANAEFFDQYEPATIKDFVPQTITMLALLAAGTWIAVSGPQVLFVIAVLVAVFAGLGIETHNTARYWRESMGISNK